MLININTHREAGIWNIEDTNSSGLLNFNCNLFISKTPVRFPKDAPNIADDPKMSPTSAMDKCWYRRRYAGIHSDKPDRAKAPAV